jgi:hypothetical protein
VTTFNRSLSHTDLCFQSRCLVTAYNVGSSCASRLTFLHGGISRYFLQLLALVWTDSQLSVSNLSSQFSSTFQDELNGFPTSELTSQIKFILRPTVSRPVCPGVRPVTNFSFTLKSSLDSCGFVIMGRPLWREGGSVIYSFRTHASRLTSHVAWHEPNKKTAFNSSSVALYRHYSCGPHGKHLFQQLFHSCVLTPLSGSSIVGFNAAVA